MRGKKSVEDELDKYKKSSDKYLDKVSFLEKAYYKDSLRETESERRSFSSSFQEKT